MLVDDEENIIKSLKRVLRPYKEWDVESYLNADDALKRARSCIFDVIISDYKMPGTDGIEFLTQMKELQPEAMRILLTGTNETKTVLDAINQASAFKYITKPWNDDELIETVSDAINIKKDIVKNKFLAQRIKEYEEQDELFNLQTIESLNCLDNALSFA